MHTDRISLVGMKWSGKNRREGVNNEEKICYVL